VDRNLSSRRLLKELRFKNLYPMLLSSSGKDFSKSFSETFARGSFVRNKIKIGYSQRILVLPPKNHPPSIVLHLFFGSVIARFSPLRSAKWAFGKFPP